jgi:DNA (cytosine-5)-methyltransferase 1
MEMLNELALFAGAGGGILGGLLAGWRTVCAVEWDAYAACILVARQNDGTLAPFPIWDDVQTFDGRPWRGRVDVVSGGFPCTDISAAGKGAGIDGEASGMWRHMARIIGEVRPRYVLVENSPMLVGRGLARVVGDFAAMGYDARWGVLGAADVGAPHQRDRIWIVATDADCNNNGQQHVNEATWDHDDGAREVVADTNGLREIQPQGPLTDERGRSGDGSAEVADTNGPQRQGDKRTIRGEQEHADASVGVWWCSEPDVGRVAHGVANRVDRLRCIGNGQVPRVAALAWEMMR